MTHTATALASWINAIRKTLIARGVDADALMERAGLDAGAIGDPNARYPVAATTRLWELAVEATDDPALGLEVSRQVNPTTFHALGYALAASATLAEAFSRLVRYFRLVTDAADLSFEATPSGYRFQMDVEGVEPRPAYESMDAFITVNVRMCRRLYGDELNPTRIRLQRPAPVDPAPWHAALRAPIEFGAAVNTLEYPREPFETPLETANPELARLNEQAIAAYLARYQQAHMSNRVHAAIIDLLPNGAPTQAQIAARLHMSTRNLQRKLAAEDTSYQALLDRTRRELARDYLRDARYSIDEVTYLLGFSEASSFARAFKRWTGVSPSEFRETAAG